jgi:hypothetical protein
MVEGFKICKKCFRLRKPYNSYNIFIKSLETVQSEYRRLEREEKLAEKRFLERQQAFNEAVSRLISLRKRKAFVRNKGVKMV